jgi:protein TonB
MPYALLLSPDDQAVSAITGVLEEMSVTCERPLDGVSAAQKLNSQNFDLVLVDCENLPAAKLIFDVCRRGKNGHNPIPIAIVDGRAGLPTAFRLGAELILTKPVAKDQARGTIRTAVSRVRKGAQEQVTAQAAAASHEVEASASAPQELAFAAAAAGSSSSTSTLSDSTGTSRMHSAVEEIDAPASDSQPNTQTASSLESTLAAGPSVSSNHRFPVSDDPVLADLEATEKEESGHAQAKQAEVTKAEPQKESPKPGKAEKPAAKPSVEAGSSRHGQQKTKGLALAFLMLALAASGFYAAWTYQPAFRVVVQPQVDRVLSLVGMALPPTPSAHPVKPSAAVVTPKTETAALPSSSAPAANSTSVASEPSASDIAATPATTATTANVNSQAATTAVSPAGSSTSATADKTKSGEKSGESKPTDAIPIDSKTKSVSPKSSSALLPDESNAVLLSSKSAESRLIHSVPPTYPAEARSPSSAAQATVVLKEVVDETGKVEGVRLVDGNSAFAPAAIQAVKQWRYRPFVRDGKAQPFQSVVTIDFQRP